MTDKPFSQACENNKGPILQVISKVFTGPVTLWEIGSGTGQHASYFAQQLPHIVWQPTDKKENLSGIARWVEDAQLKNLKRPVELDVTDNPWPCNTIDALFTANTLHIMSWREIEIFFASLNDYLNTDAFFCIYGPFNNNGTYTSDSNANFDQWLKDRDSLSGIRGKEAVERLAQSVNIQLLDDVPMPANNRLLIWQKKS